MEAVVAKTVTRAFVLLPRTIEPFAVEVYAWEIDLLDVPHTVPIIEGWMVRVPHKKSVRVLTQNEAISLLLEEA